LDACSYANRGWLTLAALLCIYFAGLFIESTVQVAMNKTKRTELRQKLKAEHLGTLPKDIDALKVVSITPPSAFIRDAYSYNAQRVFFEYSSPTLYKELDALLEFRPVNNPRQSHGCRGYAYIEFYQGEKLCQTTWNYAHGSFFFPGLLTDESRKNLCKWFSDKGYDGFQRQDEAENGYGTK
jgi:hypothetical protein